MGQILLRIAVPKFASGIINKPADCNLAYRRVQPIFQLTPTRPTFLFRQITRQSQRVRQLSKVRSKLEGNSATAVASNVTHAPSMFRFSTVHSCIASASKTLTG